MSRMIVYSAPERNKAPILEVLQQYFDHEKRGNVLEISSGTGQHVSFFASHFPLLTFQPSEYEHSLLDSIKAYAEATPTKNVLPPVSIDVSRPHNLWPIQVKHFDYVLNINMIHYAPFECTQGLFKNAAAILPSGGLMVTYGPYAHNGIITPQSNIDFNEGLKMRDPRIGLRDVNDLQRLAEENGIKLLKIHDMPANNKCLIWQKNL